MGNGLKAIPVIFNGESGYMVSQYHNGKMVVEQFVPESAYKDFCEAIGIVPVMKGAGL